jgi:hypothetical protein
VPPSVKKLMSWVRPGVLLTNARRRRPASVLMALDLPAFERPANAISGAPARGRASGIVDRDRELGLARGTAPIARGARARIRRLR